MLYREEKPSSGTILIGGLNVGKISQNCFKVLAFMIHP
jgi:hypothetical protein